MKLHFLSISIYTIFTYVYTVSNNLLTSMILVKYVNKCFKTLMVFDLLTSVRDGYCCVINLNFKIIIYQK